MYIVVLVNLFLGKCNMLSHTHMNIVEVESSIEIVQQWFVCYHISWKSIWYYMDATVYTYWRYYSFVATYFRSWIFLDSSRHIFVVSGMLLSCFIFFFLFFGCFLLNLEVEQLSALGRPRKLKKVGMTFWPSVFIVPFFNRVQ